MTELDRYLLDSRYWTVRVVYENGEEGYEEPWGIWICYQAKVGRSVKGIRVYCGGVIYEGEFKFPFLHPLFLKIGENPSDVFVDDLVPKKGEAVRICTHKLLYNGVKIDKLLGVEGSPWQEPLVKPMGRYRSIDEVGCGILSGEVTGFTYFKW